MTSAFINNQLYAWHYTRWFLVSYVILTDIQELVEFCYPHITDEKTETKKVKVIGLETDSS